MDMNMYMDYDNNNCYCCKWNADIHDELMYYSIMDNLVYYNGMIVHMDDNLFVDLLCQQHLQYQNMDDLKMETTQVTHRPYRCSDFGYCWNWKILINE